MCDDVNQPLVLHPRKPRPTDDSPTSCASWPLLTVRRTRAVEFIPCCSDDGVDGEIHQDEVGLFSERCSCLVSLYLRGSRARMLGGAVIKTNLMQTLRG